MTEKHRIKHYSHDALLRYARYLGTHEIHTVIDKESGLHAIIAIHSTKLGSAIGGCRLHAYPSISHAFKDVLRLSYGMTLKAAVSGLSHGGAKAVIIRPPVIKDRQAFFRAFGNFVHKLDGRYITAMDMGTSIQDMDTIAKQTPHVIGQTNPHTTNSDPSPFTARGCFRGIQAAVKHRLKRDSLDGVRVSVQGLGKVAYTLSKLLIEHGATVTACDTHPEKIAQAVDELGITSVDVDKILDVPTDVFAPCAIGGTINADAVARLDATIIAGAANNQLAHRRFSKILHEKGVLYAPEFALNAGGLIQAASLHDYNDIDFANQLIERLYDRMLTIFERSASSGLHTIQVAEMIANERLQNHQTAVIEEVA